MIIENYLAIILLALMCLFYGISLDYIFKFTKLFNETIHKIMATTVIGFGLFSLMIFVLGAFRIKLYFWLFFAISLILPLIFAIKNHKKIMNTENWKIDNFDTYQLIAIVIIIIVIFNF